MLSLITVRSRTARSRHLLVILAFLAGTLGLTTAGVVSTQQPAAAANGESVQIGMPFEGQWAYDAPTNALCGPGDTQTAHPSCHEPYGYHWATDVYAPDGTDVRLKFSNATGGLTYQYVSFPDGGCGHRLVINIKVDSTWVGQVYFDHLKNEVSSQAALNTAMSGNQIIGKVDIECHFNAQNSWPHAHIGVKNISPSTGYSCYYNHSNTSHKAGMTLSLGTDIGLLGANGTAAQQECSGAQPGIEDPPSTPPAVETQHTAVGDFNNDGWDDIGAFYSYANSRSMLWVFYGSASGPQDPVDIWDSGPGNWNADRAQYVAGDFNNDDRDDIAAMYDYGGNLTQILVFYGNVNGEVDAPVITWGSGAGNWALSKTKLVAGNFDGDDHDDLMAFYQYGGNLTQAWLFAGNNGLSSQSHAWSSGAGNWILANTKLVSGNFDGDSYDDVVAMYDYGNSLTRIRLFYGNAVDGLNDPVTAWDSGAGNWALGNTTLVAGNFDGDSYDDVGAFFQYASNRTRLWVFYGSASSSMSQTPAWDSGVGNWLSSNAKYVTGNFDGGQYDDIGAFYNYPSSRTRLWAFYGSASGPQGQTEIWDSGVGDWNWYHM